MDHRRFVAELSPDQRRALTGKSDRRGLAQLALHGGAILVTGTLIGLRMPLWPLLLPVQGVLVVFLFTAMHESIHRTAFARGWLNDAVARLCGFLVLVPADWFRHFHFAHHRHTQDPDRDPELAAPKPATRAGYLWHVSGLPLWWGQIGVLVRNALGRCDDAFVPPAGRARVRSEARAMLAAYAALAGGSAALGSAALVWLWVVPALLGQPALRLYLLAEHGRCPFAASMFENSRTTFTTGLVRRLAWNMPYHAEHHAWPMVPFHRLPALHALVRDRLRVTERGYVRFHRNYVAELT